jgi:hypothetical protein
MTKQNRPPAQATVEPQKSSTVSIADILRKGNLSVGDPGPVTPPTAQISTGAPRASSNSSADGAGTPGGKSA